jgi:phage terminase large subunit
LKQLQQLNTELVRQQGKRTVGSQLIQLVGEDEMRAKKIPSPNMADALMMCFMLRDKPKKPAASTPPDGVAIQTRTLKCQPLSGIVKSG